jgi:release factor glutamine methyltransferase
MSLSMSNVESPSSSAHCVSGLLLWQWRQDALAAADVAGINAYELDWFLQTIVGIDPLALRLQSFRDWPTIVLPMSLAQLSQQWQLRTHARVPVQYLAGKMAWRDLTLMVSPAVLIPRPETEHIIDWVANLVATHPIHHAQNPAHWVDLGTGSGAIALGLAQLFPDAQIHAVDISLEALAVAQANARLNQGQAIQFYQGDWWEPLQHLQGLCSGVVANPPYIPTGLLPDLQIEVANHEPWLALDGGADGLDCIRQLIDTTPNYLVSGGVWMLEIMDGQASAVANNLRDQGQYQDIQIHRDLGGVERFVSARRV